MEKCDIVDSIYSYVVDGLILEKIGKKYNLTTGEISNILEPYGITGKRNAERVNGFYGYNLGIFKNGYTVEISGNGYNEGDVISVTREKIKDFVYHRGDNQTLEHFLQYGPPKARFKSVGKITAIVAVSIITVSVINPFSLFEVGTTETHNVVSDFFIELKDNIVDIAKDTFIVNIFNKASDKVDEYNMDKISKENAQVIENTNHMAMNDEPGYFMVDNIKYIGIIKNEKPLGECFSLDITSQFSSIGTFYEDKIGINGIGVKSSKELIQIGYFEEDIQQNGLSLNISDDKIIISKIDKGEITNIVKDSNRLCIDKSLENIYLIDSNDLILATYYNESKTWKRPDGNSFEVNDYDLELKNNIITLGLFYIKNNHIYYNNSEIFISVDIFKGDMQYNSLLLYNQLEKEGDYKASSKVTGCDLKYNKLQNNIKYTYLTDKMKHEYTKNLND